jgi:hypothetical protein
MLGYKCLFNQNKDKTQVPVLLDEAKSIHVESCVKILLKISYYTKILGSHSGKYEHDSFLRCSTVMSLGSRLMFQRCVPLPSSRQQVIALMMQYAPLKCWSTSTRLHNTTSQ